MAERLYEISYFVDVVNSEGENESLCEGRVKIKCDHLPIHWDIIAILNEYLPNRTRGGWYSMESLKEAV